MVEYLEAIAELTNQKVRFTGVAGTNPAIMIDYVPPLGDGQGYMPLELLLTSLAACSGATVASLLRRMGKTIEGLKVNARGIRRDTHPLSFQKIYLKFTISSQDIADSDMQKALQLSEETYCPMWAMVKNNVEVTCEHQIVAPSDDS